jgi:hypothetical protein
VDNVHLCPPLAVYLAILSNLRRAVFAGGQRMARTNEGIRTMTDTDTALAVSHAGRGWDAAEAQWRASMLAWHGLTPAPGRDWPGKAACAHWLTRKGHRGMRENCSPWWARVTLWDHARAWLDTDGNRVITLEPYCAPGSEHFAESLAELRARLDPLDVTVLGVDGRSPYGADVVVFLTGGAR